MHHTHLDSSPSTQAHLKSLLEQNTAIEDILVSTSLQTEGVGRSGNTWKPTENALAFSFTLKPNEVKTLTSLELGVLICDFLETLGQKVCLKWPNDLLTSDLKKCGGILCQLISPDLMIVGIGLNWGEGTVEDGDSFKFPAGSIFPGKDISKSEQESIPSDIFNYILSNRIDASELPSRWEKSCMHLNKKIKIVDGKNESTGTFVGIGKIGEALLEVEGKTQSFVSGSLFTEV